MNGQTTVYEELVSRYFACLNETHAERRREMIEQIWVENGKFGTPLSQAEGHAAINALIEGVQSQFPGSAVRRTSPIDGYGEYVRFGFAISLSNEQPVIGGVDFGTVVDGKFEALMGFFDFIPSTPTK